MPTPHPTPSPLNYHSPPPSSLSPPPYGLSSLLYGLLSSLSALLFLSSHAASPFSVATLLSFPLVAAIPIFGLTAVVRGVDALSLRRQPSLAIPGLLLSLSSMTLLAHILFSPH